MFRVSAEKCLGVGKECWDMVFQERKMMAHAFLCSLNGHMSVGGG